MVGKFKKIKTNKDEKLEIRVAMYEKAKVDVSLVLIDYLGNIKDAVFYNKSISDCKAI